MKSFFPLSRFCKTGPSSAAIVTCPCRDEPAAEGTRGPTMVRPTKLSFQQPEVMDYADFNAGATCPVQRATFIGFNFLANVAGIIRASDLNMVGSA